MITTKKSWNISVTVRITPCNIPDERSLMKALSNSELTTFCSQFALILRSGISSLEGLSIMIEDTPEGEGRQLLEICSMKWNLQAVSFLLWRPSDVFLPICAAWYLSPFSSWQREFPLLFLHTKRTQQIIRIFYPFLCHPSFIRKNSLFPLRQR